MYLIFNRRPIDIFYFFYFCSDILNVCLFKTFIFMYEYLYYTAKFNFCMRLSVFGFGNKN